MSLIVRDSVNNRNQVLTVDGSGKLSINDATSQGHLANIKAAVEGTLAVADSSVATKISTLITAVEAQLDVADSTGNTHLAAIKTAVEGTLTTTAGVSRTAATLTNAAVVSAADYTSSIDGNLHRKVAVYGSSTLVSQQLRVFASDDGTNWYERASDAIYANGSSGDYHKIIELAARYIRLQYQSGATETTKYSLIN